MAVLTTTFLLNVLTGALKSSGSTLGLGTADQTEVSGGSYAAASYTLANWYVATINSRPTAYNQGKVLFPTNETSTSYTASHALLFATWASSRKCVFSHAFELGSVTVAPDTRVKINAAIVSGGAPTKHRGIFVQLWEAS